VKIAAAHGRTAEEVALRWNLQAGYAITNRPTDDYAPDNAKLKGMGQFCTNDCETAIVAMAQAYDWSLTEAEVAELDALSFTTYSQSPTYYSSAGCPESFGTTFGVPHGHPTGSACSVGWFAWC